MFWAIAAIEVCIGVGKLVALEVGVYCTLLTSIVVFFGNLPRRFQVAMLALACLVTASPFFGPPFALVVPGTSRLLPVCELALPHYIFHSFYVCGEFSLRIVGDVASYSEFHDAIYFAGSFDVRPCSVLVFWAGITLAMASSLVLSRTRLARQRNKIPCQTEALTSRSSDA
jgi:hypothetical protein